jgi:hypothetical protein
LAGFLAAFGAALGAGLVADFLAAGFAVVRLVAIVWICQLWLAGVA